MSRAAAVPRLMPGTEHRLVQRNALILYKHQKLGCLETAHQSSSSGLFIFNIRLPDCPVSSWAASSTSTPDETLRPKSCLTNTSSRRIEAGRQSSRHRCRYRPSDHHHWRLLQAQAHHEWRRQGDPDFCAVLICHNAKKRTLVLYAVISILFVVFHEIVLIRHNARKRTRHTAKHQALLSLTSSSSTVLLFFGAWSDPPGRHDMNRLANNS
jgi:hypothetical protein